jgi:hypothetical protein
MNNKTTLRIYFLLCAVLTVGLLIACSSPLTEDAASKPTPTPSPAIEPSKPTVQPSHTTNEPSSPVDRVDVVYFHRPQRCKKCLCFEERVDYVIKTHFQDEIESGLLTFQILDLGDLANADMARKYSAVGSQLFITTIKNGEESIRDIQEIWGWNCTSDEDSFDQEVRNAITQCLDGNPL